MFGLGGLGMMLYAAMSLWGSLGLILACGLVAYLAALDPAEW